MKLRRGSTSVRRLIFIADSSSTTGAGLANLTHSSAGLVWNYFAGDLNNDVQITLVAGTLGTYTSGGFVAVDNTNMPGWYEIGIPNAALDGGNEVSMQLRGATNMVPVNIYIELDAVDYQDATAFGLSRLDAAVSSRSTLDAAGVRTAVGLASANLDTQISGIATAVWSAGTRTLSSFGSLASDVWAVATRTLTAASDSSGVTTLLSRIVGTLASGTHNPQSGDSFARLGAPAGASIAADIQTRLPTSSYTAPPSASTIAADVWSAATRTITGGTITTVSDKTGYSLSQAFPTNFAALSITVGGAVTAGTVSDKTGYSLATAPPTATAIASQVRTELTTELARIDVATSTRLAASSYTAAPTAASIADAVWDELIVDHSVNGSFGARVLISSNTQREVQVTGSNHVSADVHAFQADVITSTALAASAVTEIQSGLATQALLTTVAGYLDTEIAAIKAKTDNLPTDPADQSAVETAITTAKNEIISSLPGTGSGARSVTITVRDPSAVAVQNALVRLSRTGETFSGTTNASGVVTFSVDDATWNVTITATGFSFSPTTLVVDGTETVTYTLTSTGGISPSPAGQTTGYWTVYDQSGTAEVGATIVMQTMNPASGSTGLILEDATRTAISGAGGLVQFTGLFKGATYRVYRQGSQRYHTVTVPTTAGASVALGSIVG